jgi:hypothetical protein
MVVHSLLCCGHDGLYSQLPHHAGQTNAANEQAWSPLTVSGVSCGVGGKKDESLTVDDPGRGF